MRMRDVGVTRVSARRSTSAGSRRRSGVGIVRVGCAVPAGGRAGSRTRGCIGSVRVHRPVRAAVDRASDRPGMLLGLRAV
jgi:hypothetical protein